MHDSTIGCGQRCIWLHKAISTTCEWLGCDGIDGTPVLSRSKGVDQGFDQGIDQEVDRVDQSCGEVGRVSISKTCFHVCIVINFT